MKKIAAIGAVVWLCSAPPSYADYYLKGSQLSDWCLSENAPTEHQKELYFILCRAYVAATADAIRLSGTEHAGCIPSDAELGQLVNVTKKWIADNRNQTHLPAISLITAAMSEAFPCQ